MSDRLEVLKTYKLYIGGKFPRTESGRFFKPTALNGDELGNICLASRKDFRNAVVAARKAQGPWAERTAYNRGQILYRIAENLESRKAEFAALVGREENLKSKESLVTLERAIDSLIYYAGWADKYQAIFSSVNPVSSSHFNFSILEAVGVVACLSDSPSGFLAFLNTISSAVVSGNSLIILASENNSASAMTFAEVLATSDVPGGVVNILTGRIAELKEHFATHMDVNSLLYVGGDESILSELKSNSTTNLKRVIIRNGKTSSLSPYAIKDFLEVKTTWHPIEQIGGSSIGY